MLYAGVGAPDVALTEVLIGTLLSTLLYIVTIRSCYTVVLIQDKSSPPRKDVWDNLMTVFDELHLQASKKDFVDTAMFHWSVFSWSASEVQVLPMR